MEERGENRGESAASSRGDCIPDEGARGTGL